MARCQHERVQPQADTISLTGLIYASLHGATNLEIGGRAGGAKGLGSVEATAHLLFSLLRSAADSVETAPTVA